MTTPPYITFLKHWVDQRGRTFSVRSRTGPEFRRYFAQVLSSNDRPITVSPDFLTVSSATRWARRMQHQLADADTDQKGEPTSQV